MQENTNKAIAVNSMVLYAKLIIVTVTGLLTTRFALTALGITDFGLFSVLGSIISFIGIFNTIMLASSNRFISVAIGKGVFKDVNEQFNINLTIHVVIALLTLIIAIPMGDCYVYTYIHYDGDISKAVSVFNYSVIGSVISFVGVPFNGLLMAKERFILFSFTEAASHIVKMIVAYLLIDHFVDKLSIYAISQAGLTAATTIVYYVYCKSHFPEIIQICFSRNKQKYKEVLSFSSWVAYGALATVGKNQGAALFVNAFFNTAMNTALGLANTVNLFINQFCSSIAQPMAPQITKSYAAGNIDRSTDLLVMSTKFTFLVTLCVSAPFLVAADYIFRLWLGQVPPYVVSFTTLIIVDTLVISLNSGISNMIFASGKIKLYQVSVNTLRLISIAAAYWVLKMGGPAHSLLWAYIAFSAIIFIVSQWVLHHSLNFNNSVLIKRSYIPSIAATLLFFPACLLPDFFHPLVQATIIEFYLIVVILFIGLSKAERLFIRNFIRKIIHI